MTAAFAVPSVDDTTDTRDPLTPCVLVVGTRMAGLSTPPRSSSSNRGPFFTPHRAEGRGRRNAGAARPAGGEAARLGKSREILVAVSLTSHFGFPR